MLRLISMVLIGKIISKFWKSTVLTGLILSTGLDEPKLHDKQKINTGRNLFIDIIYSNIRLRNLTAYLRKLILI